MGTKRNLGDSPLRTFKFMKHIEIFERFYNPPIEIKNRLDKIVDDLLIKYEGGRPFFDALDREIKNIINNDMILALVKGNINEYIATSGEFGDILYKMWKEGKFKCKDMVVFGGKMRTNRTDVNDWYPSDFNFNDKNFIYIDDSLFSGSTYQKINNFLKPYNSTIKSISVIYDGSKEKNKMIKSFFRYYK